MCESILMIMSNGVTFQLDTAAAGEIILQGLSAPLVKQSAESISARASSMATSLSSKAPDFTVTTQVGIIKVGSRAIATVTANLNDSDHSLAEHQQYIAYEALTKARDAGRVS